MTYGCNWLPREQQLVHISIRSACDKAWRWSVFDCLILFSVLQLEPGWRLVILPSVHCDGGSWSSLMSTNSLISKFSFSWHHFGLVWRWDSQSRLHCVQNWRIKFWWDRNCSRIDEFWGRQWAGASRVSPMRKCAGVRASKSSGSAVSGQCGREFRQALILMSTVASSS